MTARALPALPAPRADGPRRCHRHTRYWLAACPDCTRYHLHEAGVTR